MSDERRQQLINAAGIAAVLLAHSGIIAGLAWMGEWRVWRFITDFTIQLDAALLIGWVICSSIKTVIALRALPENQP